MQPQRLSIPRVLLSHDVVRVGNMMPTSISHSRNLVDANRVCSASDLFDESRVRSSSDLFIGSAAVLSAILAKKAGDG